MQEIQPKTIESMTNHEIAKLTGKQVSHINRDIIKMMEALTGNPIQDVTDYKGFFYSQDEFNRVTGISLVKELTLTLVSGYSIPLRAKIIKRWTELEQAPIVHQIPQTLSEALQLAANQAKQLEEQAPKVEFVDNYVTASDTKTLSDVAKLLNIPNRQFFKKLTDDKILFKRDGDYRPYAYYEPYFTMKTGSSGDRTWVQCRANSEGIVYLSKRYGASK